MTRETLTVHLDERSYQDVLTSEGVSDAVYAVAVELAAVANAHLDHPEEGELYVARRSDGPARARAQVIPANARTAAHDNKHQTLVRVMEGGL